MDELYRLSSAELNYVFHSAIKAGDLETIKKLVRIGLNFNSFAIDRSILLGNDEMTNYLRLAKNSKTKELADLLY